MAISGPPHPSAGQPPRWPGRKRKSGRREPSGRYARGQNDATFVRLGEAPTTVHRLLELGPLLAKDKRAYSWLALLYHQGKLTKRQCATGFEIGRITGRHDALQGFPSRSAHSCDIGAVSGNAEPADPDDNIDPNDGLTEAERQERREEAVAAAADEFETLCDVLLLHWAGPLLPVRLAVNQLCCENARPADAQLPLIRKCLDEVADALGGSVKDSGVASEIQSERSMSTEARRRPPPRVSSSVRTSFWRATSPTYPAHITEAMAAHDRAITTALLEARAKPEEPGDE